MRHATLTSKGQVTIPKAVRDRLQLESGDRLNFIILEDGRVLLQPATLRVTDLKGILYKKGRRAVSVGEMNTAIAKRAGRNK
ncbi:MAG: AbrB/MazE/SpoVT family DNA-binding domain-containing protein [Pseudomonadota bacterium]|jgi:AbrB family looped-hinge helix DNA binding protein